MDLSSLPLTFEGEVEKKHADFLDHMNVMWYTHFFDSAIWNFYDSIGFGHDYHNNSGWGSFALEAHVRYHAELRPGDDFKIYIRALKRNAKLFHFIQYLVRARDNELSATQEMLGVHIDMKTRRSAPMPPQIAELWDGLIAEHSRLPWQPELSGSIQIK
jgi:acyl-CoA thioester hydrolase